MNRGAVLIAVLLVSSAIAPAGLALAQDNTYSKTIDGHPEHVIVNQQDIDGKFTVEVSTTDGPGGSNVTLARQRLGSGAEKIIQFNNERAYESVTLEVTVHGTGSPSFGSGSDRPVSLVYFIGSTGGDRDLTCDTGEQISSLTNPYVEVVECGTLPGSTEVNTTNADAEQVKLDIYQSAQNQQASSEIYHTTLDNYLEDTATQARILSKNAYIRALNTGASEAASKTEAKTANANYYSIKYANLVIKWNAAVAHAKHLENVTESESGVSESFHSVAVSDQGGDIGPVEIVGYGTTSVTLPNGTTMTAQTIDIKVTDHSVDTSATYTWDPFRGTERVTGRSDTSPSDAAAIYEVVIEGIHVDGTDTAPEPVRYLNFSAYPSRFDAIESQRQSVDSDIDTIATNTYDAYQAGEINNSDLIDPYVFSQEFSPGDEYQGWAAAQLTMLGTNSPEAMDSIGRFDISTADGDHTGVLMSQTNPDSGQFETNTTYDPANITGTQYVVTDDRIVELTTPFEIRSIETTDGERRQNVTIEKTTYETADVNTTQLTKLY
ncbi:hypothetical protein IL252_16295, partial [Halomicrobium sp. IBSBa]|uniref:hypothetical protein n=1 Tax=Halomicrobium sp. IBSBa TaxID=2778916 RepID=UPI001ABEF48F